MEILPYDLKMSAAFPHASHRHTLHLVVYEKQPNLKFWKQNEDWHTHTLKEEISPNFYQKFSYWFQN